MGENEPGHRSCSEHISIKNSVQKEQEMEDSIGRSVVNGFLMEELGDSKDTTKMDCSDLRIEDSLEYTKSVQYGRNRVQRTTGFLPRT